MGGTLFFSKPGYILEQFIIFEIILVLYIFFDDFMPTFHFQTKVEGGASNLQLG